MEKNYLAEKKVRNFFNSFVSFFVIHDVVIVSILLTDYFNPYRYSNGAFVQVVSIRQKGDWLPVKHGVNFRGWLMNCADNCPSLSCKLLQSCYQTLGQEWIKPWSGFISKQQWRVCYNLLKKWVFFTFQLAKGMFHTFWVRVGNRDWFRVLALAESLWCCIEESHFPPTRARFIQEYIWVSVICKRGREQWAYLYCTCDLLA